MWHLHDLLAIAAAMAVILVMLRYGDFLDPESLLRRTLTASSRLLAKIRRKDLPPRG